MSRKNIVLDLDSTLIWENQRRPYVAEFAQFCEKNFGHVSIWTAGTQGWLELAVTRKIPEFRRLKNITFLWDVDRCVINSDGLEVKPLSKIYALHQCHRPHNTILLEDRDYRHTADPQNCLNVRPFYGHDGDRSLLQAMFFLEQILLPCKDVRTVLPYGPL